MSMYLFCKHVRLYLLLYCTGHILPGLEEQHSPEVELVVSGTGLSVGSCCASSSCAGSVSWDGEELLSLLWDHQAYRCRPEWSPIIPGHLRRSEKCLYISPYNRIAFSCIKTWANKSLSTRLVRPIEWRKFFNSVILKTKWEIQWHWPCFMESQWKRTGV